MAKYNPYSQQLEPEVLEVISESDELSFTPNKKIIIELNWERYELLVNKI